MNFLSKTIGKLPVKNIDFSPVVERELANRAFAETLQREKDALGNYIESSQNAKTGTQEATAQPVQIEAGIQATPEPNRQTNFKNAVYDLVQSELTKEQAPTYRNPSDVIAGFSTGQTGKEKLVNGLTALAGYLNSSSGRSLISNLTGAAAYAPSRHAAYQKSLYEMEEDRQRGASNSERFNTLIKLMSHLDDVDLKNRKFDFEKERAKVGDEQWEKEFGLNMKKFEEDVRVHGLDYAAKQQELALRRAGLYEQIRSNKAQEGIAREKMRAKNTTTNKKDLEKLNNFTNNIDLLENSLRAEGVPRTEFWTREAHKIGRAISPNAAESKVDTVRKLLTPAVAKGIAGADSQLTAYEQKMYEDAIPGLDHALDQRAARMHALKEKANAYAISKGTEAPYKEMYQLNEIAKEYGENKFYDFYKKGYTDKQVIAYNALEKRGVPKEKIEEYIKNYMQ